MGDPLSSRTWVMRIVYLSLSALAIFAALLPLQTQASFWAPPDLLLALTFAWAIRRPSYVPILSVALVFLMADLLFQRPPGLCAALVVLATETLRARAEANRNMPYLVEWLTAGALMCGVFLAERLIYAVFFIPQPALGLSLIQTSLTIVIYPVVVLISHLLFGVRRVAPGEMDAFGT